MTLERDLNQPRELAVLLARSMLGFPYKWGGNTPADGGMDCSGGYQWILKVCGFEPWASKYPKKLDMTAGGLWTSLASVGPGEHPLPGDPAFYGRSTSIVEHVVMVVEVEHTIAGGLRVGVIGASRGYKGLTDINSALAQGACLRYFTRHTFRDDFLGFRRMPLTKETTS